MASTFLGLNTAYTGLQAAQIAINTTAHNISNAETEGYSRQKANATADDALRAYAHYGTQGCGVIVNSIEQIRDSYYDVKYRNNETNKGYYNAMESYMLQIEDYLNEYTLDGFTEAYADFFTCALSLYETPAEEAVRNEFINKAHNIADYFNTLSTNLQNVQKDVNEEIKNKVEKINTISRSISSLNKQINQIEANKGLANDLRDSRNNLLDELSEIINVTTFESDLGEGLTHFSVFINGQCLVDGNDSYTLATEAKKTARNASDANGMYDISWASGIGFDEHSPTLNGDLKALLDIRDGCNGEIEKKVTVNGEPTLITEKQKQNNTQFKGVPYYQAQLNQFVQTFTTAVNEIFAAADAETIDGEPGVPIFVSKYEQTSINAASVTVNEVLNDQSKLATTTKHHEGESYNDLIGRLIAIRDKEMYDGGTGAYFLEGVVGDVAIDSSKAKQFSQNFTNLKNTIQNQRLSVMGVDQDEEGMAVMKYQQAYNLNAKMMSVMQQIYDKLINGTGI